MARFTYNGVTVEVSDETAAHLSSDYKPVEEKKAPAKKAASSSKSTSK
jgi:hypothetical protein